MFEKIFRRNRSESTEENPYADENVLIPSDQPDLHRNLQERHMIMIALGGTIGTGLFLAAGQALASAGPAGSLVSYLIISVMVYFVMTSLGSSLLSLSRSSPERSLLR